MHKRASAGGEPDERGGLARRVTDLCLERDADATALSALLLPAAPSPLASRFAALCQAAWTP